MRLQSPSWRVGVRPAGVPDAATDSETSTQPRLARVTNGTIHEAGQRPPQTRAGAALRPYAEWPPVGWRISWSSPRAVSCASRASRSCAGAKLGSLLSPWWPVLTTTRGSPRRSASTMAASTAAKPSGRGMYPTTIVMTGLRGVGAVLGPGLARGRVAVRLGVRPADTGSAGRWDDVLAGCGRVAAPG